jgi:glycosyltransferase involved in cell wall biosynthesis
MRLLFLSAWCPLPADNGSKIRIWALLRELSRWHEFDLVAFAPVPLPAGTKRRLEEICQEVELVPESPFPNRAVEGLRGLISSRPRSEVANYSPRMASTVQRRAERGYDLVVASQLHMAPYALLIPGVPRLLEEVELGALHDQYASQHHPIRRLRYGLTWWKSRRRLAALLEHFAAATVVSQPERALLESLAPRGLQIETVPNGVDVEACSAQFGPPEPDVLVYPGALSYAPNLDAVRHFASSVLPRIRAARPGVRLRVLGRAEVQQRAIFSAVPGIELTGYLVDARPAVAQAWAEVVPLRIGGGTRLKVLEALALGTPVVSTPKGVEGLELEAGRQILVANSDEQFAALSIQLLENPALRERLAAAGRLLVRERYAWSSIATGLNTLIEDLSLRSRPIGAAR